jgi:hypothetical protein
MNTITICYNVSNAYRQAKFEETGKLPEKRQSLTLDAEMLTPEQRAQIFAITGLSLNLTIASYKFIDYSDYSLETELLLDIDLSLDDIFAHCRRILAEKEAIAKKADEHRRKRYQEHLDELTSKYTVAIEKRDHTLPVWPGGLDNEDRSQMQRLGFDLKPLLALIEEYKGLYPVYQAEADAREKEATKHREREKAETKARKAEERLAWARDHGSERLRRAIEADYNCNRLYWNERAALEYPGYTLDYDGNAEWKDRSCPSLEALNERDEVLETHPGIKATIVWLTDEPQAWPIARDEKEYDYSEEFEQCEAVLVDDPAYEHNLIRSRIE